MNHVTRNVCFFLLYFIRKQWLGFFFIGLTATLAGVVSNSIWPYMIGQLVDSFSAFDTSKHSNFKQIATPLFLTLAFWILIEIMQRGKGVLLAHVAPQFEANIRMFTFKKVLKYTHEYFIQQHTGAVAQRIDNLPSSARLITDNLLTFFFPLLLSVVISSSFLLEMHLVLALTFFGWLTLHFAFCIFFCIKSANCSSIQSAARAAVQGAIVDSITNYLSVKIFNGYDYEFKSVQQAQDDQVLKFKKSLLYVEKFKIILALVSVVSIVILFSFAIHLWFKGRITVGDMVFIANTTVTLMTSMWYAGDEISYVLYEIGMCKQSLVILQETDMPAESREAKGILEVHEGKITFEQVTFNYKQNGNLFQNKSLVIPGRQKVGLVGFSGSGKTTFTNLIMRLHEVAGGSIKIDEQDIAKVSFESLRGNISFIPQEPLLFHRSILENIRYGQPDATYDEVTEAAKKSEAHEFIMQLPEKYDTIVGERGAKLSGGQKQRIAISRAVLKSAPIVIMDEATSALDSLTEQLLQKSLNKLMKDKTVIVIAHRLSTLLHMDRILVFDKGGVVEEGTHSELISRNGHYATLWNMHHNGVLPEFVA